MIYSSGVEIRVGDVVLIGNSGKGTVVANIERREYCAGHSSAEWGYLGKGVMIDTDFGGVIHYPDQASLDAEGIVLIRRGVTSNNALKQTREE
jgi:hypothetical protein